MERDLGIKKKSLKSCLKNGASSVGLRAACPVLKELLKSPRLPQDGNDGHEKQFYVNLQHRWRMYSMSMRTHSAKLTRERPRTCQMQVKPGVTSSRRFCHRQQAAASSQGRGLGPTSDISPRSTFQNCGNSSMLVGRRTAPQRRDPRIATQFEGRAVLLAEGHQVFLLRFRVRPHGTELVDRKRLASQSCPPLLEEERPARLEA